MVFGRRSLVFVNYIGHIAFIMSTMSVKKSKLGKAEKARQIMKELGLGAYINRLKVFK